MEPDTTPELPSLTTVEPGATVPSIKRTDYIIAVYSKNENIGVFTYDKDTNRICVA